VARSQNRALLGLVHKARKTRFGHDHDFGRIHSARDFRRLVPLRTPAELWREYWQPAFPRLAGATWPGPIACLAVSSAAQSGAFPYMPISTDFLAAQQMAIMTALAFVLHALPQSRICSGRLILLGSDTGLSQLDPQTSRGLEIVALRSLPGYLRPLGLSPALELGNDGAGNSDQELTTLAERSSRQSVTCLVGSANRLCQFLDHARRITKREMIREIWPRLTAVFLAPEQGDPVRSDLISYLKDVLVLEVDDRPDGILAVEDPRYRCLRLVPDQSVYFEFVPLEQLGRPRPERFSAEDVRLGQPYALAVSSSAGIWACLIGSVIRFERLVPPLFRLVEAGKLWERVPFPPPRSMRPSVAVHTFPPQPPHARAAANGEGWQSRLSELVSSRSTRSK
jgi:hypothetical protein